jgi:hypothetical protein
MKLTKTYYFQYGSGNTPDVIPAGYSAPSGEYANQLDVSKIASIYINIPFKVKKIHIKNLTYTAGRAGNQGNADVSNYVTFLSSLVGNRPVGMVHRDSQFSMGALQDIEHLFQIPVVINGFYDFTTYFNDGSVATPWDFFVNLGDPNPYNYFFDSFCITIEFNGEDEIF